MKKLLIAALALSTRLTGSAQHEADNWYFGSNAALTFSSGSPVGITGSPLYANEGCASLSDHAGNLLFYSNGSEIWSRNNVLMPNGTGLHGSSTCSQSALFTTYPGHDSLFYLFTPPDFYADSFCYSIVDLTLNGGYGDITSKNVGLFDPSTEKVTAVRRANNAGIWVIGHSFDNADFYVYGITTAGINPTPVISTAGTPHTGVVDNKIGIMKVSPCGNKIALTVIQDAFVELFDFDDATGVVSNAIHLGDFTIGNAWGLYGLEFSPDGSRLYVTQEGSPGILVQYDLLAGSPGAIIASADTITQLPPGNMFGSMQMGPDGKIYIARITPNNYLSCISDPNALGAACTYVDNAVALPSGWCTHGLPNFMSSIFLDLSDCAGGTTGMPDTEAGPNVQVMPNPGDGLVSIQISGSSSPVEVQLLDPLGRIVRNDRLPGGRAEVSWDLSQLVAGIYFVRVNGEGFERTQRFVKR